MFTSSALTRARARATTNGGTKRGKLSRGAGDVGGAFEVDNEPVPRNYTPLRRKWDYPMLRGPLRARNREVRLRACMAEKKNHRWAVQDPRRKRETPQTPGNPLKGHGCVSRGRPLEK